MIKGACLAVGLLLAVRLPAAPAALDAVRSDYGVGGVFIKDSEEFAHGLNERIRVDAFYDALTYWFVLIKTLAGGAS